MGLKAGIVGMPNVGKSTLFNAITLSQVEAANYPFATIEPNSGVVEVKDTEKPVIDTTTDDIYVCPGCEVVPEELKATDNYDGDLSKAIVHSLNKEKDVITYSVKDTSGNVTEVSKKILYHL